MLGFWSFSEFPFSTEGVIDIVASGNLVTIYVDSPEAYAYALERPTDRIYYVDYENRVIVVNPEIRVVLVSYEKRTLPVDSEIRVFSIEKEDRTLYAKEIEEC